MVSPFFIILIKLYICTCCYLHNVPLFCIKSLWVICMKKSVKNLIIAIVIPLLVGGLSALLAGGMDSFQTVSKPPLSPPGWLFPVVWSVLYILMGIASYLVYTTSAPTYLKNGALLSYAVQLFFNFMWSIIFFRFEAYLFAFIWLIALLILIIITAVRFYKVKPFAGVLLLPYIAWVAFAGYLNLAIYILNR